MAPQQKAIARSTSLPASLNVIDRPIPSPGKGEVLVRIKAAALNPVDWKAWKHPDLVVFLKCAGLGTDVAGVVEAIGDDVGSWKVGDRIVTQGMFHDDYVGLQEYALATAHLSTKIPDNISYEQAATLPVAFAAALHGSWGDRNAGLGIGLTPSFDSVPHYKDEAALVIGGSSSVGQYAIQIFRISGFSTIIAYASSKHTEYLKSLGATHVLDRNSIPTSSLSSSVRQIASGGVRAVLDAIAYEDTQLAGYDSLVAGGGMALTLGEAPSVKEKREAEKDSEGKSVVAFLANAHMPGQNEIGTKIHESLGDWLAKGIIIPNRYEVVAGGLAGVEKAFERMARGDVSGLKLVVRPEDAVV